MRSEVVRDLSKVLASVSSDVDPGSVYLFDAATGKSTLQYRSRPELPSEHLAHMQPVSFTARDGMIIHGRSDAVLNPGGVRIGTAEIYREVDKIDAVIDYLQAGGVRALVTDAASLVSALDGQAGTHFVGRL